MWRDVAIAGVFELNLMAAKPAPGAYTIKVSVNPANAAYKTVDNLALGVKVFGEAVVSTATVRTPPCHVISSHPLPHYALTRDCTDRCGGERALREARDCKHHGHVPQGRIKRHRGCVPPFPRFIAPRTLRHCMFHACLRWFAVSGAVLQVTFDVKSGSGAPLSAHQVFVKLSGNGIAKPAVFVATADSTGSYRVSIDTASRDALKSVTTGVRLAIAIVCCVMSSGAVVLAAVYVAVVCLLMFVVMKCFVVVSRPDCIGWAKAHIMRFRRYELLVRC